MFIAYQVSLEGIRCLRPVVELIASRDPNLADQIRRAATAVPLQLQEARRRRSRDRTCRYRAAGAEAGEVLAGLDAADAWAYAEPAVLAAPRAIYDRLCGLIYPLYA